MFKIENFIDNDDIRVVEEKGAFQIIEYLTDLSVTPDYAMQAYYMKEMHVRKRQVVCNMENTNITTQTGAMQWTIGNVNATTGIKGVGDFVGKMFKGSVTGEGAVKPEYTGNGILVLEPSYKHLFLLNPADYGGSLVLDDGLFMACDSNLKHTLQMRSNLSSAALGNEGLFNMQLEGNGYVVIESATPRQEMIEVELQDDVLKVDGSLAVAWSGSLQFTVERAGKSLIGSAASGEGLVNTYRGTGRVLMTPVL